MPPLSFFTRPQGRKKENMAKVNGALLSLGARGQLGGAMVFSNWKGIGTARQYVVPANPQTAGQVEQRSRLTLTVAFWKAKVTAPYMRTGWNLAATLGSTVQSGFNAFTSCALAIFPDNVNGMAKTMTYADTTVSVPLECVDPEAEIGATSVIELWTGATAKSLSKVKEYSCAGGSVTETATFSDIAEKPAFAQVRKGGVALSGIVVIE
jgi:hypothetical protein